MHTADTLLTVGCGQLVEMRDGAERWHLVEPAAEGPFTRFGFAGQLLDAGELVLALKSYPPEEGPGLFAYRPPTGEIRGVGAAHDIISAFAGLRSGWPYEGEADVPADVLAEMGALLGAEGAAAWEAKDRGLRDLWDYYPGFRVLLVEPLGEDRFRAVVSFSTYTGPNVYRETLTLAPGNSVDGRARDLVVVDATGDA